MTHLSNEKLQNLSKNKSDWEFLFCMILYKLVANKRPFPFLRTAYRNCHHQQDKWPIKNLFESIVNYKK